MLKVVIEELKQRVERIFKRIAAKARRYQWRIDRFRQNKFSK